MERASLEEARDFAQKYDPARFHYPINVSTGRGMSSVRQPDLNQCRVDPQVERYRPFRYSSGLTPEERKTIEAALFSAKTCTPPMGLGYNPSSPFLRGMQVTTLRSILGKQARVIDWRLASQEERDACTKAISRPLPEVTADYTFMRAYTEQAWVMYDVGWDGMVRNAHDVSTNPGPLNTGNRGLGIAGQVAAERSRFEPPVIAGQPVYCINVTEQMLKIGDGNGGMRTRRNFANLLGGF